MIVDNPFLAGLAVGSDRNVPQAGDAQVIIPSVLQPVIEPLYPLSIVTSVSDSANTSKLTEDENTVLNVAATTFTILSLPKGLYTLQLQLGVRSNFTTIVMNEAVKLSLLYQGTLITLAYLHVNTGVAHVEIERTILLTSTGIIQVEMPATNAVATNSIAYGFAGNIIRRI